MDKETGFISHLVELRKRLIHSLIFLSVLFVICYFFSEDFLILFSSSIELSVISDT